MLESVSCRSYQFTVQRSLNLVPVDTSVLQAPSKRLVQSSLPFFLRINHKKTCYSFSSFSWYYCSLPKSTAVQILAPLD